MIQRIQSIFLLVSSIALFLLFAFNFLSSTEPKATLMADNAYNIHDNIGLLILTVIAGAAALLNIFLFNNRKLQMKIGNLILLLCLGLMGLIGYLGYNDGIFFGTLKNINISPGLFMPAIALIMAILANRFINKDEKKVRSSDRLR